MERIPEPELMEDEAQARAYAEANFAEPHSHFIELLQAVFPHMTPLKTMCLIWGAVQEILPYGWR